MNTFRIIVLFIVALILVAVAVANREPTTLDLVAAKVEMPLFAVILIAWAFGLVSYAVIALIGDIQLRARLARQKRETELLMHELNDLRNLPVNTDEIPAAGGPKKGVS